MAAIGKTLILIGIVFIATGALMTAGAKIPFLGKLLGDLIIERKHFTLYFPLVTCILISIILTLILRLLNR